MTSLSSQACLFWSKCNMRVQRLHGGWIPGSSRWTVPSHYHCLRERESEKITSKGNGVDVPNLLNHSNTSTIQITH